MRWEELTHQYGDYKKMIFKQGILKEEKIKFAIVLACALIPLTALIILGLLNNDNIRLLMTFALIFYFPIFLLSVFWGAINLEWFYVYDDRIEVKYIFGDKNIVYYDEILFVEELKINLTNRGMEKEFYIFNDGRKNNNNILGVNSCYNKKKFNLRIYKTAKLENYIISNIKSKII